MQYYIKRYGARVRTAVLKGVVTPTDNIALSYGRHPQRAFERLVRLCNADAGCASAHPDLRGELNAVLTRLERAPARATATDSGGRPVEMTITRGQFAFALRSQMASASAVPRLPALIGQAASGDFSQWAPILLQVRQLYATQLHGGMTFSVAAAEDVPRLTEEAIRADAQGTFIGDALSRSFAELGGFWPRGEAHADLFAPLETDVPILLVSGDLDPATPPEGAEAMMGGLPNGLHIVFAGGAHSAANFTGLDRIIADFISAGSVRGLDARAARTNRPLPFQ